MIPRPLQPEMPINQQKPCQTGRGRAKKTHNKLNVNEFCHFTYFRSFFRASTKMSGNAQGIYDFFRRNAIRSRTIGNRMENPAIFSGGSWKKTASDAILSVI
jgi:hypothetical protein